MSQCQEIIAFFKADFPSTNNFIALKLKNLNNYFFKAFEGQKNPWAFFQKPKGKTPSLADGGETLVDLIPIDDAEKRGHIVGTAVLIIQVVGMFPHINAHDRGQAIGKRAVLICGGDHSQATALFDEPSPT